MRFSVGEEVLHVVEQKVPKKVEMEKKKNLKPGCEDSHLEP